MRTSIHFKSDFSTLSDFGLLEAKKPIRDEDPADAIKRGAAVRCVKLRGRLQPFLARESVKREWTAISRTFGKEEKYSFASRPEQPVHSTNLENGRVLSYEARKEEVLGQLDYLEDAERVEKGLLEIHCLEIGESVMLLLEHCEAENKYLRIGVSHGYREDFFATIQLTELLLV